MTENRRDRKARAHAMRRQIVVKAARSVIARDGVAGATLRAVANEAGYSPAAIYRYFPTREHVFAGVLQVGLSRLAAAVERSAARMNATQMDDQAQAQAMALGRGLRRVYDHFRQYPGDLNLAVELMAQPPRGDKGGEIDVAQLVSIALTDALHPLIGVLANFASITRSDAEIRVAGLIAQMFGLLILETGQGASRTIFSVETERVVDAAIETTITSG